jgi:uncharacterized protein (TIGR02145 family)
LPSATEWDELARAVGGNPGAGRKLKSTSGWNNNDDGTSGNGTNDYGFSALPGGYRYTGGSFNDAGGNGYWWTATAYGSGNAYSRLMYYGIDDVFEYNHAVGIGLSVRCVGD